MLKLLSSAFQRKTENRKPLLDEKTKEGSIPQSDKTSKRSSTYGALFPSTDKPSIVVDKSFIPPTIDSSRISGYGSETPAAEKPRAMPQEEINTITTKYVERFKSLELTNKIIADNTTFSSQRINLKSEIDFILMSLQIAVPKNIINREFVIQKIAATILPQLKDNDCDKNFISIIEQSPEYKKIFS